MGEKKVLGVVMFVMAYCLAVTTFTASQVPATCNGFEPLLFQCVAYLVLPDPGTPSAHCCDGARVAFQRANNPQAIQNFCSCLVDAGPYLNFQPSSLVQLPVACKIKPSFSMDKCIYG
ncbi:non-specific lipid-transfer protein 3 [Cajanus cajan]|uniref:Bifunctional inhibitor/plant lipid transfer protein/seed storage helical domain-containing protein n=1 Tax=Cajanus cajan TaxID=3821 RepID=A0A151UGI0_CAJCA|nr:non-specific lipid-transfer protein 3 [Cajanus cajan]